LRLILIRHGETLWNETHRFQGFSDIELNPVGKRQAQLLAESLKEETFAAVYTSPLIRARQTAEEIARYHQCPVIVDEGLKELNQGLLEGLTAEDLKKGWPELLKNWIETPESVTLPGGESLINLQKRAWSSIEKMLRKHSGESVAAVAHSFVNLTILCQALKIPLRHFRRFRQSATGKNIIEFNNHGVFLRCLNDTCHMFHSWKK
jgi:broad specificity phosphatase PhoE